MLHKYNNKQLQLSSYYNNIFLKRFGVKLYRNHYLKIRYPIFNRRIKMFYFEGLILKTSKSRYNINRTIWFDCKITKTEFIFISPVYNTALCIFGR